MFLYFHLVDFHRTDLYSNDDLHVNDYNWNLDFVLHDVDYDSNLNLDVDDHRGFENSLEMEPKFVWNIQFLGENKTHVYYGNLRFSMLLMVSQQRQYVSDGHR